MKYLLRFAMVIAVLPIAISRSDSVIEYEWTGDPIPVDLLVGTERRITVKGADELRIGIPPNLYEIFTAQSIKESTWWSSDTPIESARVIIGVIPTGEFVVAEVTAAEGTAPPPDLVITIPPPQLTSTAPSRPTTTNRLRRADPLDNPTTLFSRTTTPAASRRNRRFGEQQTHETVPMRPVSAIRLRRICRINSGGRLEISKPLRAGRPSRKHDRRADRVGSPRSQRTVAHRRLCSFKAPARTAPSLHHNPGPNLGPATS